MTYEKQRPSTCLFALLSCEDFKFIKKNSNQFFYNSSKKFNEFKALDAIILKADFTK